VTAIRKFEDILSWRKARELTRLVYRLTASGKFSKDYALKDQLRRASVSVMLNIAEGFARRTNKEFVQFLGNAHGSVAEVQSALYVALDCAYMSQQDFDDLYGMADEVSRLISRLSTYLKKSVSKKRASSTQ